MGLPGKQTFEKNEHGLQGDLVQIMFQFSLVLSYIRLSETAKSCRCKLFWLLVWSQIKDDYDDHLILYYLEYIYSQ